jgi:phage portal protein BeeE
MAVAMDAAGLLKNANTWMRGFFERSAIPAMVLTMPSIPDAELARARRSWERFAEGGWRTLVLSGDVQMQQLQNELDAKSMLDLQRVAEQQIVSAFGVPSAMVGLAIGKDTAAEHRRSFYQDTVIPHAIQIATTANRQHFSELGQRLVFDWKRIEAFQRDRKEEVRMLRMLVDGGIITEEEARDQLGYD